MKFDGMVKPFDMKVLLESLKGEGLDVAEEVAAKVLIAMLNWTEASVKMTENKYDDFFLMLRPMLEPELNKLVDKIDGQVG